MIVREFLHWADSAPTAPRADAAHALARAFLVSDIHDDVREEMEAAMTVLLDDEDVEVRFALADALASDPDTPRHLILALAGDVEEIAALVLARSPVFLDAELVDIAASADDALQIAIAKRPVIWSGTAGALAEVGCAEAVEALLANLDADIALVSLRRIAERFGDDIPIRELLLDRDDLPVDIHQTLVRRLGQVAGGGKGEWNDEEARREVCERGTIALAAAVEGEDLIDLVDHLRVSGQLTTSLLLRALCSGNIAFFEVALAILADVPLGRVEGLVRHRRRSNLKAIYQKAKLPAVAFDAFVAALDTCAEFDPEATPVDRYRFTRSMVERVLERYDEITDGEVTELLSMLRRFAADASRHAARAYVDSCLKAA